MQANGEALSASELLQKHWKRNHAGMSPSSRPLWLSPRQVMVVPVNPSCEDYAKKVSPRYLLDPSGLD